MQVLVSLTFITIDSLEISLKCFLGYGHFLTNWFQIEKDLRKKTDLRV